MRRFKIVLIFLVVASSLMFTTAMACCPPDGRPTPTKESTPTLTPVPPTETATLAPTSTPNPPTPVEPTKKPKKKKTPTPTPNWKPPNELPNTGLDLIDILLLAGGLAGFIIVVRFIRNALHKS